MRLILDSNEYIFALGTVRYPSSEKLIDKIAEYPEDTTVRIVRLIVEEVRDNLTPEAFKEFMLLINAWTKIDEDFEVPFELGTKYETLGLKPPDALIAAFSEYTGADVLVTENRHFLSRRSDLPFKVLTAEGCLKILGK